MAKIWPWLMYKVGRNIRCYTPFSTHPPLQPKRIIIETSNLAWGVTMGIVSISPGRFSISAPWAEIWGWGWECPCGVKNYEIFFWIFLFFSLPMVRSNSGMTKNQEIIPKFQFCGIKRAFGVLLKGQNLRFKTLLFPIKWDLWDKFVYLGCGRTRSNQWQ